MHPILSHKFIKHVINGTSGLFIHSKRPGCIGQMGNALSIPKPAILKQLFKPNEDPTLPFSYRPLPSIYTDIKMIAKALASRLETVLPS